MSLLVSTFLKSVRTTLQETTTDGIRWTVAELVDYLNQSYDWLIGVAPEAFTDNSPFECVAGTRQQLPDFSVRLIDVTRNLEGSMRAINLIGRERIDRLIPDWHSHNASKEQQHFVYDERDPKWFYVYPPAQEGSLIELVSAMLPNSRHTKKDYDENVVTIHVNERYTQALKEYILFLCFDKDSEESYNMALAQTHLKSAYNALGLKMQNDVRVSPSNPANKS
jgi:hypothetical protein